MSSTAPINPARLRAALERASTALLAERTPQGHWVGELSSSALSTATAVTALAVVQRELRVTDHASRITSGLRWLAQHQNADGGWGDTVRSQSNLSTTTLCWAAFGAVPGADEKFSEAIQNTRKWIARYLAANSNPRVGSTTPADQSTSSPHPSPPLRAEERVPDGREAPTWFDTEELARAVIARYGKDRTFSVPILTLCALAGRLGTGRGAWKHVIPLPFELAACPHSWFAALRLPVVSYALPALIAIGQARHYHRPSRNPIARVLRHLTKEKTLRKLTGIQPPNGGFLEATPLTSFVTMSLAGSGQANHPVTKRGVEFLVASQRPDGSWPIDTNLATWLTTLSVNAVSNFQFPISNGSDSSPAKSAIGNRQSAIRRWLLTQQYRTVHPYTHAAPGGWAWTDLPGGVPDADDTAGALLALRQLGPIDDATREAAFAAIEWLLNLQNKDGGIPTFCRGWGALPFDQSSPDITAHVVRAWLAWHDEMPAKAQERLRRSAVHAVDFLKRCQRTDGAWSPLWFGNQHSLAEQNLLYGTARVLPSLITYAGFATPDTVPGGKVLLPSQTTVRGIHWLLVSQHEDGSWGGTFAAPPSIEETALAIDALASLLNPGPLIGDFQRIESAIAHGTQWLLARVESGEWTRPSPIGFYFAKLWYYEKLYPMIFTVGALNRVAALLDSQSTVTR